MWRTAATESILNQADFRDCIPIWNSGQMPRNGATDVRARWSTGRYGERKPCWKTERVLPLLLCAVAGQRDAASLAALDPLDAGLFGADGAVLAPYRITPTGSVRARTRSRGFLGRFPIWLSSWVARQVFGGYNTCAIEVLSGQVSVQAHQGIS